jgi:flavin-dependent dehydrogenase
MDTSSTLDASLNGPALGKDSLTLEADVLVVGGGPAGTWAARTAAAEGARVVLSDKGYCGTSRATAPSGVGVWYVPPDPDSSDPFERVHRPRAPLEGPLAARSR